ncbi:hypothetical protein SCLARK_001569 [Spiroplasma clarkii]|nr:hypothetical protein SCLARK_001569 [Spiroplasma clarkii]
MSRKMIFANYDFIDGALSKDGALFTNFVILLGIGLVVTLIPTLYALYLFVGFKKVKVKILK